MKFNQLRIFTFLLESFLKTELITKSNEKVIDIFKKYKILDMIPEEVDIEAIDIDGKNFSIRKGGNKPTQYKMGRIIRDVLKIDEEKFSQTEMLKMFGELQKLGTTDIEFELWNNVYEGYVNCDGLNIDSCSTGPSIENTKFYDWITKNTDVNVYMLFLKEKEKYIGRALLWENINYGFEVEEKQKGTPFLDRIYPSYDEKIIAIFHEFASNKNLHKHDLPQNLNTNFAYRTGQSHDEHKKISNGPSDLISFNIPNKLARESRLVVPYMDTFRYFEYDNFSFFNKILYLDLSKQDDIHNRYEQFATPQGKNLISKNLEIRRVNDIFKKAILIISDKDLRDRHEYLRQHLTSNGVPKDGSISDILYNENEFNMPINGEMVIIPSSNSLVSLIIQTISLSPDEKINLLKVLEEWKFDFSKEHPRRFPYYPLSMAIKHKSTTDNIIEFLIKSPQFNPEFVQPYQYEGLFNKKKFNLFKMLIERCESILFKNDISTYEAFVNLFLDADIFAVQHSVDEILEYLQVFINNGFKMNNKIRLKIARKLGDEPPWDRPILEKIYNFLKENDK